MRAVIQRVSQAQVLVDAISTGKIDSGLVVLLGVHAQDSETDARWMVEKILHLRIFADEQGLMNRSLLDTGGSLLVVSQFTLLGDCRKGRRPSWHDAAPSEKAKALYETFLGLCRQRRVPLASGVFQAMMQLSLCNDGPVTILLDSHKIF
ncbi:MAG: D-aminoacyl-tRNA deacylase [Desulfobulbus sp.]|jgi:D-tyrosyl-tRNA(Tyr) deacylase|nr:D-tyrosyl-tRNA(Tyr) deacylase [Desulfobulbaceae bacterium]